MASQLMQRQLALKPLPSHIFSLQATCRQHAKTTVPSSCHGRCTKDGTANFGGRMNNDAGKHACSNGSCTRKAFLGMRVAFGRLFNCTDQFSSSRVASAACRMDSDVKVSQKGSVEKEGISAASIVSASLGIQGFQARVDECNIGLERRNEFGPFYIGENVAGYLHSSFMMELGEFEDVFLISPSPETPLGGSGTAMTLPGNGSVQTSLQLALHPKFETLEQRTRAVGDVLETMRGKGQIPGWRNELYPVSSAFGSPPLLLVERAAAAMFGVKVYGVHLNGFVRAENDDIKLWVARRSASKPTFPGRLDHLVAGGQPHGLSCAENVVKECDEEAGIPFSLSKRARPVGAVSYEAVVGSTLKRDVLFCYDLELPSDFIPFNKDGEVESFELLSIETVADIIGTSTKYKTNCALVIIDFLVRHGLVTPEQDGYLQLVRSLRQGDCS